MSATKHPNNPEGWRAEIQHLKETIRKSEEMMRNHEKLYPKTRVAADGKIDQTALTIIRTIYLHKNTQLIPTFETTESKKKLWDKVRSSDPLLEREKAHILKAVFDFDRAFLQSLIKAMDLCEFGGGINKPNVAAVITCHDFYKREHKRIPTNRQLLALLHEQFPATRNMDGRTLAFICKSQKLPLARGKRGRPVKKGK